MKFKKLIKKIIYKPPIIEKCSQTVYQSLIAAVNLYEITKDERWLFEIVKVSKVLLDIQQSDGGFDIGYDFNFGYKHKKGESTSPELYALVALNKAYDVLVDNNLEQKFDRDIEEINISIKRGVGWISRFAFFLDNDNDEAAIPYGPYSVNKVMVYNGVSFAAGALGPSLRFYQGVERDALEKIYMGFCRYLLNRLTLTDKNISGFWFYSDQERDDLSEFKKNKIDFYHQAQQLEVHCYAQRLAPNKFQERIIKLTTTFLEQLSDQTQGIVPYTNSDQYFRGNLHMWGLASVASALAESPFTEKLESASNTFKFILEKSWNGSYFYAVLDKFHVPLYEYEFMPRSDAWVLASLTTVQKNGMHLNHIDTSITLFKKIVSCNFTGRENHAVGFKQKLVIALYKLKNYKQLR